MAYETQPVRPGPRLNEDARDLIRRRIVAGDSNREIRGHLHDAGYPSDIIDQSFTHYRRDPEVMQARQLARMQAMQIGYADLARQVELIDTMIKDLVGRLNASNTD